VRVVWTRTAARGVQRVYEYLVDFNPRAAAFVAQTLRDEGNGLVDFPHRGGPVPETAMRELVTAYPYIIRYRIDGDTVVILCVRHTSRRPTIP
jgi:toxin ParE1/3/4